MTATSHYPGTTEWAADVEVAATRRCPTPFRLFYSSLGRFYWISRALPSTSAERTYEAQYLTAAGRLLDTFVNYPSYRTEEHRLALEAVLLRFTEEPEDQ